MVVYLFERMVGRMIEWIGGSLCEGMDGWMSVYMGQYISG